jgi:hypothetical protein
MGDLRAAVQADRLASYVRLKGGFPIPLAGAVVVFGVWIRCAGLAAALYHRLGLCRPALSDGRPKRYATMSTIPTPG